MLVLAHGYAVNGVVQNVIFPFSDQVDAQRFIYVEAHGTQDRAGHRFWNATDACCNFTLGLFRRAPARFAVQLGNTTDPARFSNGSFQVQVGVFFDR